MDSEHPKNHGICGTSLASILRIPVYMHHVDRAQVLRPAAWTAFGTHNLEDADIRACTNFGPLY